MPTPLAQTASAALPAGAARPDPGTLAVAIVAGTPGWVWALLAALCLIGLLQLRDRRLAVRRLIAVPLAMAGWSLVTAVLLGAAASLAWVGAVSAAVGIAVVVGRRRGGAGRAILPPAASLIPVAGSPLPLLLILAVFTIRYALNVVPYVAPQWPDSPAFGAVVGALLGLVAGGLVGRTLLVLASAAGTAGAIDARRPAR